MSQQLTGKKVAFLVATEGVEQIELTDPWDALVAERAQPSIVSTESGAARGSIGRCAGTQWCRCRNSICAPST